MAEMVATLLTGEKPEIEGFLMDRWPVMASDGLPGMVTQQQMRRRKRFVRFIYKTRLSV
jgi:hypothetical protein